MFGRQARMPIEITLGTTSASVPSTVPDYVAKLHTHLKTAYTYVRDHMGHKMEQQKTHYNEKTNGQPYDYGDLVWLHYLVVP